MAFIVPALAPNTTARNNFGACFTPMGIADPNGVPATGIVTLRGAIARSPQGQPPQVQPHNLLHLFTLPAGMRPIEDRWLTCQVTSFIVHGEGKATLCIVRKTGEVHVNLHGIGYDGAVFFDGVSFFAERKRSLRRGASAKKAGPLRAKKPAQARR